MNKCLVAVFILLLAGCDLFESGVAYTVDNPKDQPITVSIDDKEYQLPATSHISVELKSGIHSISYQGETVKFFLFENSRGGIINPTLSNYYVNYIFYTALNESAANDRLAEQSLSSYKNTDSILGNQFSGYFFKDNRVVIEKLWDKRGWDVELDDGYDNEVLASNASAATRVIGKIFREKDYIAFIASELGSVLTPVAGYQEPAGTFSDMALFYPPLTMKYQCAGINNLFDDVNKKLAILQSAETGKSERIEIKKQLVFHTKSIYKVKAECAAEDLAIDNQNSQLEPAEKYYDKAMATDTLHARSAFLLR